MCSHWGACKDFSLKVFFISGRGTKKSLLSVFTACVCVFAEEVHVWESLLRSGAMEHHIVLVRVWDDDCFVCFSSYSAVTALSLLMLRCLKEHVQHMHWDVSGYNNSINQSKYRLFFLKYAVKLILI